ncbi:hypothetical protein VNO77_34474 [Canavalia gladiata]|uniref:Uncharacterized protein n=1 Tax=Canavalia gladiata TaxID=3824 RepID=A0AAN9KGS9_CANGL
MRVVLDLKTLGNHLRRILSQNIKGDLSKKRRISVSSDACISSSRVFSDPHILDPRNLFTASHTKVQDRNSYSRSGPSLSQFVRKLLHGAVKVWRREKREGAIQRNVQSQKKFSLTRHHQSNQDNVMLSPNHRYYTSFHQDRVASLEQNSPLQLRISNTKPRYKTPIPYFATIDPLKSNEGKHRSGQEGSDQ